MIFSAVIFWARANPIPTAARIQTPISPRIPRRQICRGLMVSDNLRKIFPAHKFECKPRAFRSMPDAAKIFKNNPLPSRLNPDARVFLRLKGWVKRSWMFSLGFK